MKCKYVLVSVLIFGMMFLGVHSYAGLDFISMPSAEITKIHQEVIYPCVRVSVGSVGGSGTLIYSQRNGKDFSNYVLTNYHVIQKALTIKKIWDPTLGKEVKKEFRDIVKVGWFIYKNESYRVGVSQVDARIITYTEEEDMALLKLEDNSRKYPYSATLLPKKYIGSLRLNQPTWAVGCSLGHPPIITPGVITSLFTRIDRYQFGMSTSQIIFGNSGGAIYIRGSKRYYLIGIPSAVPLILIGFGGAPITHMGLFIPINRIFAWLDRENLQFLYDKNYTEAGCMKKRKEMEKQKASVKMNDLKLKFDSGTERH